MLSVKGILKNAIYVFIAGWMFFLGILVGRETSPVTFDTSGFQRRLAAIVLEAEKKEAPEERMELQFYDALNSPVQQEVMEEKNNQARPKNEPAASVLVTKEVPVKTSRKAATLNKAALSSSTVTASSVPKAREKKEATPKETGEVSEKKLLKDASELSPKLSPKPSPKQGAEKQRPKTEDSVKTAGEKVQTGMYTIQVAAYPSFTDAVTHMAALEKKGVASYRTLSKQDGVTWYRIRVGSFETREEATLFAEKLKQAKIDGMIIKKE